MRCPTLNELPPPPGKACTEHCQSAGWPFDTASSDYAQDMLLMTCTCHLSSERRVHRRGDTQNDRDAGTMTYRAARRRGKEDKDAKKDSFMTPIKDAREAPP